MSDYLDRKRHSMVPAIYVVIKNKEGKILAILRKNTGWMDNHWTLPSGHVEEDELPLKGAVRETLEEVNLSIKPEDLRFIHLMTRPKEDQTGERIDLFFEVNNWEGEPENNEPDKHEAIKWVDLKEDIPWIPNQKYGLEQIEKGNLYSEFKGTYE